MAINKAFVVKNSLEVSTDLILANADTRRVGIASTNPQYTLDVAGGIGATDFYLTGIGTFANELNVGLDGRVLTVLGIGNSIGIGTALPQYLLDIRSPVSTGQTALYIQGDVRITGDLNIDDINLDDATIQDLTVTGITTVGFITASNLSVSGVGTFLSSGLKIRNVANTFQYSITGGAITANRTLNIPVITGTDTLATLGLTQTFSAAQTFSSTLTASSTLTLSGSTTGTHVFGSNQVGGTITLGGTGGTGLITVGRGTTTQTTDIQAGVTVSGQQKTINLGTGGASGSRTLITVGSATAGAISTVAINPGTNLILGLTAATPTGTTLQPLQVGSASSVQGAYISGSVGIGVTNPGATLNVVPTSPSIAGLFSGTTSSDMVRITQLGTGNALVVEDSANPDATPFVVNAAGDVGIGVTNPEKPLHLSTSVATPLIIQRTTTNNTAVEYRNTVSSMYAGLAGNATGWGVGADADLGSDAQILVTRTGGELLVGSLSTTGTASQKLQVTGGAYVSGPVGIGSTNPTSKLSVVGDGNFTGVVTATTFVGTAGTITNFNSTSGTITNITGTAGTITTLNSTSGTITNITGTGVTYTNGTITNLTGTAGTITTLNSTSGTITNLTGTAGTITNFNSTNGTITNLTSQQLNVSGISTLSVTTATNLTSQQLNVSGVTTVGFITATNLQVSGIVTARNGIQGIGIQSGGLNVAVGVITALNFIGLGNTFSYNSTTVDISIGGGNWRYSNTSDLDGSIYRLSNVGIGTTNPTSKLQVQGDAFITGVITATTFVGTLSGFASTAGVSTSVSGGTASVTQLSVSGVSTIGVNTSSNALRITQTGSGNALVVEDETNPDATPFVVNASGSVGIGTTNPTKLLNIEGVDTIVRYLETDATIDNRIWNVGVDGQEFSWQAINDSAEGGGSKFVITRSGNLIQEFQASYAGSTWFTINNPNQRVGIGTTNPTSKLQVQGDAFITGVTTSTDFNSTSDINLKTNIQQIDDSLAKVIQIRGVTFDWKDSNRSSAGVIAQEVEKVLPELVNGNSPKTVNYNGIIAVLIEAVKELKKEIEELKSTK
jgi:hypothetical protein